ncbi:MAG TPA: flagellar M-ring protein FliF C-terminal domain-containing protein, partial [Candidatus Baltobacteraceae bacterium]|nr:flagellar M-ring protein FliF C-terminal domain-containing protein [Candidatus Baltobacteraceae bacterium]
MKLDTLFAAARSLPAALRLSIAVVLACAAAVSIVWGIASHAPRASLFATPLHPEQLSEVEEELANWAVPFTPTSDNVVVNAAGRNDVLLRLSLAGVPHAHVSTTSETLANVGVLTPQAVVDAQTRAGLAGDIEVSLRSIEGVDDARVIIAPAKTAEFADESARDGSASVRLHLHPGSELGRDAVDGIRHFVAASVTGLDPARVTILDDRGVALDGAGSSADTDALARSLQSALDAAFGGGAAIVRVHGDYAGAATERRETRRGAASAVPIVSTVDSESYDGTGKRYRKDVREDDRGSDTREFVSHSEAGGLTRLSTAVFVDDSRAIDLEKVRQLSAAAVGFNAHRGDSLVVAAVNFHRAPQPKRDGWFLLYGVTAPLLPVLALVAGALLLVRTAVPAFEPVVRQLLERSSIERTSRTVMG